MKMNFYQNTNENLKLADWTPADFINRMINCMFYFIKDNFD